MKPLDPPETLIFYVLFTQSDKADTRYHIFELEFPNPAYKGGWHGVNKVLLLLYELFDRRHR